MESVLESSRPKVKPALTTAHDINGKTGRQPSNNLFETRVLQCLFYLRCHLLMSFKINLPTFITESLGKESISIIAIFVPYLTSLLSKHIPDLFFFTNDDHYNYFRVSWNILIVLNHFQK